MKRIFLAAVLLLLGACGVSAQQNIPIFPSGPVYVASSSLVWGTSGANGFNNNFFFTPLSVNESVCVFVSNNNPTSAHTFSLILKSNLNPANITPSDNTWFTVATGTNLFVGASGSINTGAGAYTGGVAEVSINLSGSTTQAGSPDTASLIVIQTQGNCPNAQNFTGPGFPSFSFVPQIQNISDAGDNAFFATATTTNPLNAAELISINPNTELVRSAFLDRVIISSSAAATVTINLTTTAGATCTAVLSVNQKGTGHNSSQMTANTACTTVPVVFQPVATSVSIPAGGVITIDLRGFILPINSTNGIDIVMAAALTGTITETFFWSEK